MLGAFNPDSFQPGALAEAKVVSRKDEKVATFRALIPGAAVHFQLFWGEVLVMTDRMQVTTTEAPYVRICDFVVKALSDLPTEPRVHAFGINLESHFDLGSVRARDAIGVKLAPTDGWGAWGREISTSMDGPPELHGGMFRLQMRKPFTEGSISGWLAITVGPSARVANNTGVFFLTNHHHQFSGKPPDSGEPEDSKLASAPDGRLLLNALAERFDSAISTAEKIFRDVMGA